MRSLLILVLFVLGTSAFAADKSVDLVTARGSFIKIDIYNPGATKALLLAPGQNCGPRLDMYDAIAAEAKNQGFTLVRLYWAYCLQVPAGGPSQDLSTEREDLVTALSYVREQLGIAATNIFVGGKSLGTFVSFDVFRSEKSLRGLVMLTPVCTDGETNLNVFAQYYPDLSAETRSILVAQGNADPLCDTGHFQEYLKDKPNNFVPLVVKGDHGFGIKKQDGEYDPELGARNLAAISKWMFSWLK